MSATIWQTGTNLRVMGRWDNTDQGMSQNHNFEGSLRCDDHTFALRSVGEAVNWDVSGSFGPDFTSLKGSWTADGGGEFTFTKR